MRAERSGKKPVAAAVTPWFCRDVSPVRAGWYEALGGFIEGQLVRRYWNGEYWEWLNFERQMVSAAMGPDDHWRGLYTNPNEPKRGTK